MPPALATLLRSRVAILSGIGLLLLGFFAWVILAQPASPTRVLFGGVAPADVAAMTQVLDTNRITYRVGADGGTIMVGEADLGRARMLVASQGLPNAGPAGYELMDRGQSLGSTQFRDDILYLRAIEGELSRTIGALDGVKAAKVHVVMPKREPFSREWTQPTASVLLTVRAPDILTREQIAAIRHLVASAVARLTIDNVSIVDNFGNLLASTDHGEGADLERSDQRRIALEDRIARAIEEQIMPIVGPGRVRAKVRADLDLSSRRDVEESYDSLGQVPRSTQTDTERERSGEDDPNVSVERTLPEFPEKPAAAGTRSERERSRQTTNYEIGRTTREHVTAAGEVRRLSISIAVDGVCALDAEGKPSCRARSPEELADLERLARATAGFNADRGDTLEIASVPFTALEPAVAGGAPVEAPEPASNTILVAGAAGGAALVAALLTTFLLLRRSRRRKAADAAALEAELAAQAAAQLEAAAAEQALLTQAEGELPALPDEPMVDLGRNVQGSVRRATIQRVQEMIDGNVEDAALFLRGWLNDKREAR